MIIMSKKAMYLEKVFTFVENCSVADCGRYGKGYEGIIKYILQNYRGKVCSSGGCCDTLKKIDGLLSDLECKTNCGKVICEETDIRKKAYVIYCYGWDMQGVEFALYNSVVFNGQEFYNLLEEYGRLKKPVEKAYKDGTIGIVQNIQEYKTSKVAQRKMEEIISYAPTLYDFLLDNNIKFNDK